MNDSESGPRGAGSGSPRDRAGNESDGFPDPAELARQWSGIAEQSRRMVRDFLARQSGEEGIGMADPISIGTAFLEMTGRLIADPGRLVESQLSLWQDYLKLWQSTTE